MASHNDEDPRRAARRRYYAKYRDRQLDSVRQWKRENPERARQLNRDSMRRQALRRKAVEARRAAGRAWYAEHREEERARARQFRRDHPEKVREYQRRFRERHPERAAEQARRGSERWRDRHAETVRAKQRSTAAERRADDPDDFRRWYQSNIERERARGREASRLRSRLKKLGLPPRKIRRVYAEERRANVAAGDSFFSRRRSAAEKRQLGNESFDVMPAPHYALDARARYIERMRARPMSADELRTSAERVQAQLRVARLRERASELLPGAVRQVEESSAAARVRNEVRMDAVARRLRGGPALDEAAEVSRRVHAEAVARVANQIAQSKRESGSRGGSDADQVARLLRASFPHPAGAPRPHQTAEPAPRRRSPSQGRDDARRR